MHDEMQENTLLATMGARAPEMVTSGRLLKSEVMRAILGRILWRVSSSCCTVKGIDQQITVRQVSKQYISKIEQAIKETPYERAIQLLI
jgi:hypothetical protein